MLSLYGDKYDIVNDDVIIMNIDDKGDDDHNNNDDNDKNGDEDGNAHVYSKLYKIYTGYPTYFGSPVIPG